MTAFLLSTAVIFVAEMGDKSQLLALTFALRYRARDVLAGIALATLLVHLASVALGAAVGSILVEQQRVVTVLAGLAYLAFAVWTFHGDHLSQEEEDQARRSTGAAVLAVGAAFFLAELGDKTMLATITLATREGWLGTWLGSTLGMVLADAVAIGVGIVLGRRLPERPIRWAASAAFLLLGLALLAEGAGWL